MFLLLRATRTVLPTFGWQFSTADHTMNADESSTKSQHNGGESTDSPPLRSFLGLTCPVYDLIFYLYDEVGKLQIILAAAISHAQ